jgi:hypothetical protein
MSEIKKFYVKPCKFNMNFCPDLVGRFLDERPKKAIVTVFKKENGKRK